MWFRWIGQLYAKRECSCRMGTLQVINLSKQLAVCVSSRSAMQLRVTTLLIVQEFQWLPWDNSLDKCPLTKYIIDSCWSLAKMINRIIQSVETWYRCAVHDFNTCHWLGVCFVHGWLLRSPHMEFVRSAIRARYIYCTLQSHYLLIWINILQQCT